MAHDLRPVSVPDAGSTYFGYLPPTITSGQSWGFGKLFFVTALANTDTTITHGLGRIPVFVLNLTNGTEYTAKVKTGGTAWTTNAVTVQFDTALTAGLVWVR